MKTCYKPYSRLNRHEYPNAKDEGDPSLVPIEKDVYSSNFHVRFWNFRICVEESKMLAAQIKHHLIGACHKRAREDIEFPKISIDEWDQAFDFSPYKENGGSLRLLLNYKATKCTACSSMDPALREESCVMCRGGKQFVDKRYRI